MTEIYQLRPKLTGGSTSGIKDYDWGVVGASSLVAKFSQAYEGFTVDESKPYAELWFGTHASGPSEVYDKDAHWIPLSELVQNNKQHFLCDNRWNDIPYLLKVLSVRKALSIQAHPDKELAKRLHAERPQIYKDPNHKPEIAIALTPFEALCEFRPIKEIAEQLHRTPELRAALGDKLVSDYKKLPADNSDEAKSLLRESMRVLLQNDEKIKPHVMELTKRIHNEVDALLRRLTRDYPDDVGALCSLLMNHITLAPGEAYFMAANHPHAYLSGSCVECMACSDNVVRAGLTPKVKDVETLCAMLTFESGEPDKLYGVPNADGDKEYRVAAAPEFRLWRVGVLANASRRLAPLEPRNATLLLVVAAAAGARIERYPVVAGSAFIVGADASVLVDAGPDDELILFRVTSNQIN